MGLHSKPMMMIATIVTKVRQADSLLDGQLGLAEIFAANCEECAALQATAQADLLLAAQHCLADALWALETYLALLAYEEPNEYDDRNAVRGG